MRIYSVKDYDEMSKKAADIIAAQITLKPECVLGLATGSTPIGTYKNLISKCDNKDISFAKVTTVNLDEYKGLTDDHDQSYHYFMKHNLFKYVDIPEGNSYVPDGTQPSGEKACADYDKIIESVGGIDLQLLGLGGNGHIGFNEPADGFSKGTQMVELTLETREANARFFSSIDDVPTYAYTMGIGTIMSAKKVLLIASGEAKAQAVYDSFFGPITPKVPASILQLHPDCDIIIDADALSIAKANGCI